MIAQLKYAIRVKRVFQLHLDFMTWAYEIINAIIVLLEPTYEPFISIHTCFNEP